jgi:hypothetical protein
MSEFECEPEGASVVLLGSFNPAMFHPSWLASLGLISREAAQAAAEENQIEAILPQIAVFTVDRRRIEVTPERFSALTVTVDAAVHVRDLVAGLFQVLEHTPIRRMGINRDMHFAMRSERDWHRVGHVLAPKEPWQDLLGTPGTRTVVIEGARHGSPARYVRVTVEPSARRKHGVYVGTNEHFEVSAEEGTRRLMDFLQAEWDEAQGFARELAEKLLRQCLSEEP